MTIVWDREIGAHVFFADNSTLENVYNAIVQV